MSAFSDNLTDAINDGIREKRDLSQARAEILRLQNRIVDLERTLGWIDAVDAAQLNPPKWLADPPSGRKHRASVVVMLSDMHFDEVVHPGEVRGRNAYNRSIADLRLENFAKNTVKLARNHLTGVTYDGLTLLLGGDGLSGDIHDELSQTNEDTSIGSLLYWTERLISVVDFLADEFGKVHVVATFGNHPRMTRKPRAKQRAKTNFDWLMAKQIERHFAKDKRVTFQVPESADTPFELYGWHHLLTHGDQVKGGGGIGGIWPPIMRLLARKTQIEPIDTLWMGHWHQLIQTPGLVVNGSLKGWDEYAAVSNFAYEEPRQAFAVVTPEHNVTWQCPIYVADRSEEGW